MFQTIINLIALLSSTEAFLKRVANGHYATETISDVNTLSELHRYYEGRLDMAREHAYDKAVSLKQFTACEHLFKECIDMSYEVACSCTSTWHTTYRRVCSKTRAKLDALADGLRDS